MELGLRDRVVLVTGGTAGIGLAVATAFAAEGARVAVTYRADAARAAEVAAGLGDAALAVPYAVDDPTAPAAAVAAVLDRWGRLDVLVANAVRRPPRRAPGGRFEDVGEADWLPAVRDNLAGTLRTVQLAVAAMRPRGWGRIALVSSHNALGGGAGQEFYATAKAGLHGLARSLMWDVGRDGVLVNVVCPGLTTTDAVLGLLPLPVRDAERCHTPTGRLSTPAEVAATVLFLCSAANGNITGEALVVAGGR